MTPPDSKCSGFHSALAGFHSLILYFLHIQSIWCIFCFAQSLKANKFSLIYGIFMLLYLWLNSLPYFFPLFCLSLTSHLSYQNYKCGFHVLVPFPFYRCLFFPSINAKWKLTLALLGFFFLSSVSSLLSLSSVRLTIFTNAAFRLMSCQGPSMNSWLATQKQVAKLFWLSHDYGQFFSFILLFFLFKKASFNQIHLTDLDVQEYIEEKEENFNVYRLWEFFF